MLTAQWTECSCHEQVKLFNGGADAALAESLPAQLHEALRRHAAAHALIVLLGTNDALAHMHLLPQKLLKLQVGLVP